MERVKEADLIVPALRIMAKSPGGFVSTSSLIAALELMFGPEGKDAEVIEGRADTYFSQKVRNLVSHKGAKTSMESRGLATYDKSRAGWTITDEGRELLKKLGA